MTSYTFSTDILKQGVSYDFRVIAVNDYGYGTPSTPSPSVSGSQRGQHVGVPGGMLSPLCRRESPSIALFPWASLKPISLTLPGSYRAPALAASSFCQHSASKTSCYPPLTPSLMWIQVSQSSPRRLHALQRGPPTHTGLPPMPVPL